MQRKKFITTASVLAVGASLLAGCGTTSTPPTKPDAKPATEAKVGGTLINVDFADAKVLNPILNSDTASSWNVGYIFQGMIRLDKSAKVVPDLAKSWDISDDQKTITFHLTPGVKWHDGQPFTANDVAFTFKAALHPGYTGARQNYFTPLKGGDAYKKVLVDLRQQLKDKKIDQAAFDQQTMDAYNAMLAQGGIKVVDDNTIQFTLDQPYAPFLTVTAGYGILPEHLLKDQLGAKMAESDFNKHPIGTGPFKFVEWVKNDHITLQRNADMNWGYFGKPANIDKIIYKVVPDANGVEASLETGEATYGGIQPQNWDHFKNDVKAINAYEYGVFSYTYVGWNEKNPLFKDAKVRQALTMAIDRKAIVDQIMLGHGTLANTHGSPFRWDYNPDVPVFDYSPDKALAQLKDAGFTKGADGILQKDGKPFAFKLLTNKGNKQREDICVVVQQQLGKIGIKVDVDYMEWNAFLDVVGKSQADAFVLGWSLGAEPDSTDIFGTEGGFKAQVNYSNKQVDDLELQGKQTLDIEKRKVIYAQIEKLLAQDQPYTWLFYPNALAGLNKKLQGDIQPTPIGILWNLPTLNMAQ